MCNEARLRAIGRRARLLPRGGPLENPLPAPDADQQVCGQRFREFEGAVVQRQDADLY